MRQFDICEAKPRGLILILQHDVASDIRTRIVAPLSAQVGKRTIDRARQKVEFDGTTYTLQLDRMAAIDVRQIGPVRGTLASIQDDIKNGLDLLFFGF
jgi:hypothetical protein